MPVSIDERLHEHRLKAPSCRPIGAQPTSDLPQSVAGKIRYANPRKYQESRVVDYPRQVPQMGTALPTDPLITTRDRMRRARHQDATEDLLLATHEVVQGTAEGAFVAQIMIAIHVLFPELESGAITHDL
jgi:hypothetical protein